MNVQQEIERLSIEEEKPILLWLFARYHWASEWRMMAVSEFIDVTPHSRRRWHPTDIGMKLYEHANLKAKVERLRSLIQRVYRAHECVVWGNDGDCGSSRLMDEMIFEMGDQQQDGEGE